MKMTHFLGSRAYLVDRIMHYCSRKATLNISGVMQQRSWFPWPALPCFLVYSIVFGFHFLYLRVLSHIKKYLRILCYILP